MNFRAVLQDAAALHCNALVEVMSW